MTQIVNLTITNKVDFELLPSSIEAAAVVITGSAFATGIDVSKPVIARLGNNRIVTINEVIRHLLLNIL
jgi:hypothetical protein